MTQTIGQNEMAQMFAAAAARIREQHAALSALDCASGDGDHGSTMLRVVEQLDRAVAPGEAADLKTVLGDAGWRVLGVDGGASSSLLGTFFLGMGDFLGTPDFPERAAAPGGEALDCRGLAATFEAGVAAVSKQTKAQPGDKTMMDALIPAIAALRAAAEVGSSVSEAMRDAARAARAGAESTCDLTARYGRAKFLGEKTLGHQDPGATSIALLFEGFSSALLESQGEIGNARR
jgi:dihydroxyacetone kinase-like protein